MVQARLGKSRPGFRGQARSSDERRQFVEAAGRIRDSALMAQAIVKYIRCTVAVSQRLFRTGQS